MTKTCNVLPDGSVTATVRESSDKHVVTTVDVPKAFKSALGIPQESTIQAIGSADHLAYSVYNKDGALIAPPSFVDLKHPDLADIREKAQQKFATKDVCHSASFVAAAVIGVLHEAATHKK